MANLSDRELQALVDQTMADLPGELKDAVKSIYEYRGFGTIVLEFKNYHLDQVGLNMTKKAGRDRHDPV